MRVTYEWFTKKGAKLPEGMELVEPVVQHVESSFIPEQKDELLFLREGRVFRGVVEEVWLEPISDKALVRVNVNSFVMDTGGEAFARDMLENGFTKEVYARHGFKAALPFGERLKEVLYLVKAK